MCNLQIKLDEIDRVSILYWAYLKFLQILRYFVNEDIIM